jgi:hypothetical protein
MSYTEGSEQEMGLTRLANESSEDYIERLQRAGKTFGANSVSSDLDSPKKVSAIDIASDAITAYQELFMQQMSTKIGLAKLKKTLQEQLDFAEGRLIEATNQQVQDEMYKWSGYIQALRFIKSEL